MKQELFYKLKQNSLEELIYMAENKPKALQILLLVIKRTNRETGKAFIGYTDFDMTQREYRTAKRYLEESKNCKFTGTKKGTIAEISDKIFNLNIDRDNDKEKTEIKTEIKTEQEKPKKSNSIVDYDFEKDEKTEQMAEAEEQNRQSERQLTNNILKNKEYSNNINIITSESRGQQINNLIELFKDYNVLYEKIFSNKTERATLDKLITKFGYEKTENAIKYGLQNQDQYTAITKPTEFARNINKIILKAQAKKTNQSNFIDYDAMFNNQNN